ncbi:unnamed protein product, partial [Ascophyllum nodosum]
PGNELERGRIVLSALSGITGPEDVQLISSRSILSMNSISARSWRAWLERRNSLFSVRGRSLRRGAKSLEG